MSKHGGIETKDLIAKVTAIAAESGSERKAVFGHIRASDPAVADFLSDIAKTFGKPDAIAVRFLDGSKYDKGEFRKADDYRDHMKRVEFGIKKFCEQEQEVDERESLRRLYGSGRNQMRK